MKAGKVKCEQCGKVAGADGMIVLVWKADYLRPGQTHGGLLVDALFCVEGCLLAWLHARADRRMTDG